MSHCLPTTDHPRQAKFDIKLVKKLVRMVKSKFDEAGLPPHWQAAASNSALDNASSSIFVVEAERFLRMSAMEIQNVHRYRHILVTGVDSGRLTQFDGEGLQMLADLDAEVWVQRTLFPIHLTRVYLIQWVIQMQTRRH